MRIRVAGLYVWNVVNELIVTAVTDKSVVGLSMSVGSGRVAEYVDKIAIETGEKSFDAYYGERLGMRVKVYW